MWPLAFSHICESHILYRVAAIRLLYLLEQFRLTLKENVGKLHCSNRPALVHRAIDAVAVATALLSPSYPLGLVAGHVSWNYRGPFETTHRTTFPGPIFPAFGSKQRSKKVQKKQIPWEVGRSPAVWISATTKRYTPWEPRWVPSERTCILFAQCFFLFFCIRWLLPVGVVRNSWMNIAVWYSLQTRGINQPLERLVHANRMFSIRGYFAPVLSQLSHSEGFSSTFALRLPKLITVSSSFCFNYCYSVSSIFVYVSHTCQKVSPSLTHLAFEISGHIGVS